MLKALVKYYIRKEVIQGYDHDKRITGLYQLIYEACYHEFREDNKPTLDQFLTECFENSLVENAPGGEK